MRQLQAAEPLQESSGGRGLKEKGTVNLPKNKKEKNPKQRHKGQKP